MIIESPALFDKGKLPKRYSCDGENVNPPLIFKEIPQNASSLAIVFEDLDAVFGFYDHWILWNIPPYISYIKENSVPEGAVLGRGSFNAKYYRGPCPRVPHIHKYLFTVFALDVILDIKAGSKRNRLEEAMTNHIIDCGKLRTFYFRESLLDRIRSIV